MEIIKYAVHIAFLDPMTGEGLLILPDPDDDIRGLAHEPDPSLVAQWERVIANSGGEITHILHVPDSLHVADRHHAMEDLDRRGWEPSEDDDEGEIYIGHTSDGRDVIGLYGREPITSEPSLEARARAMAELFDLARVIRRT